MGESSQPATEQRPRSSMKVAAIIVALIVVIASAFTVWFIFYRHWTIKDLMAAVDDTPSKPGFKHSLAGKSVTVEGRITNITTVQTSQGNLSLVELDHRGEIPLEFWGEFLHGVGDRITVKVSFEWSVCNEERHVYSPQIAFPCTGSLVGIEGVLTSVSYTSGLILLQHETQEGKVNVSVEDVNEPIPLAAANCSLRSGRSSWASEYMDALGWYSENNESDHLNDLTQRTGPMGKLSFADANADGYLDDGDYFTVSGLGRPDTGSGIHTSMLLVKWREHLPMTMYSGTYTEMTSLSYMIVNHAGLLTILPPTPYARIAAESLQNSCKVEILRVSTDGEFPWDDVQVLVDDGVSYVRWNLSSESLNASHLIKATLPALQLNLEGLRVSLEVTDQLGNGRVDASDFLELTAEDGTHFSDSSYAFYSVSIVYRPKGNMICEATLKPGVVPISNVTLTETHTLKKVTLGPVHTGFNLTYYPAGVPWTNILLELSDGNTTISWRPDSSVLRTGSISTESFAPAELTGITIRLNITDLQGNGYMNRGDLITLNAVSPDAFLSSANYTLRGVYQPTPGDIFNVTFRG